MPYHIGEVIHPEIHLGGVWSSPHFNWYFDVAVGKGDRAGSTSLFPSDLRFDFGATESVDALFYSCFDPKIPV